MFMLSALVFRLILSFFFFLDLATATRIGAVYGRGLFLLFMGYGFMALSTLLIYRRH